ncbi:response regulator [Psychromonas sp. KJ10-10]|uniref:ATP-binding response regulator n=1 Tax=Psychromonas sp. KJ10-10 TaxID=3391823 RepID=UPI0039B68505
MHNFITKFNGKLKVDNQFGKGVDFEFRLPLSMATLRCVILRIEQELYAIPVNRIEQVIPLSLDKVYYVEGKATFRLYDKDIYLFNGKNTLGLDGPDEESPSTLVLLKSERNYFGFMVNEIINELELVDRPLPQALGKLRDARTASALPDGRPIIILDAEDLVTNMEKMHLSTKISEHEEQKNSSNKQILVVDDSLTIREVQRNMLEAHGYSVDVAVDGVDGWNHLRQNSYQLLITDIDMPRLNGWELLDKVKSHSVLSHLPVIIVSYKDNPGDFERGLQAGADSYISKGSFQDNSFIQTVNDLLGYSPSHE